MNATMLSPFSRRRVAFLVGLAGVLAFVAFIWWSFAGTGLFTFGQDTVEMVFAEGLNVVPRSSEVRVDGIEVGKVVDVSIVEIDGESKVLVEATIDEDVDLRADASAALDLKSLLGEKMVNLDPGDASAPLRGNRITSTKVGADITALTSGDADSPKLYQGLGKDTVFKGLDAANDVAPEASSEVSHQIVELRAFTDQFLTAEPDLLATLGNIESMTSALVDATGEIGQLIDTKRVIQARIEETVDDVRSDWVRAEVSIRLVHDLVVGHEAGIREALRALDVATTNSLEALRLLRAGRVIPANIWGLGTILDKDLRQPGPNPQPPVPPTPLPTEEELEAE